MQSGENLYCYVNNSPADLVDASGLASDDAATAKELQDRFEKARNVEAEIEVAVAGANAIFAKCKIKIKLVKYKDLTNDPNAASVVSAINDIKDKNQRIAFLALLAKKMAQTIRGRRDFGYPNAKLAAMCDDECAELRSGLQKLGIIKEDPVDGKDMKSSFTWGKLTSMRSNNAGRRILIGAACFLLMLLPAFADAIGVLGTSQAKCYTRSISNSRVYGINGVKAPTRAIRCVVCDRVGVMRRRTACNSQAVLHQPCGHRLNVELRADGHPRTALGDAISEHWRN